MAFTQENSRHHLMVHDIKKPYICEMCNKDFSEKHSLKEHLRICTKAKRYACEVCNKEFSRIDYLKAHLLTHTKEKPYVCEVCNKGFSQACNLKEHLLVHTKEKLYVCYVCNQVFSLKDNLKRHLRIHIKDKPYICDVCKKGFSQNANLKRHLLVHTKEKPHVCEVCNKGFSHIASLKAHLLTHAKEKPYVCENTVFGYVVSGSAVEARNNNIHGGLIRDSDLNTTLMSFCELESIGVQNENCNSEEDISLEMFKQRVHIKNGNEVKHPWKRDGNELSDNFSLAKRRLGSLMRKMPNDKMTVRMVYRFNRVLFGVNASPFLLAATIKTHFGKYMEKYLDTVRTLDHCFYVDDLITGEDDAKSAFDLSSTAKYDRKTDWDEELLPDIREKFEQWCSEASFLCELQIPRYALGCDSVNCTECEIHKFSDASIKAYVAVSYVRLRTFDKISVHLLASKSRVAPLKVLTLPRLELMGALLAARLAKKPSRVLNEKNFYNQLLLVRFDYSLELDSRSQQQMEGFRRQPCERDTIFNRKIHGVIVLEKTIHRIF
ncbi:zinc finger protein 227 [Trichonephila clavipes]|nr:zinc finger protein 227 [Trichonephila clavipes]